MAGKETAGPRFTTSSGSCSVDQGTSSAATDLNRGRVAEETREAPCQQRENQAANRILQCHVCRFAFTDMEAFENHAYNHSLGKNHNCSKCGKLFMKNWQLTSPLGTHGEPSIECGVCGKKFYTKDGRKKHVRSCRVGAQD
nr:putative zinc finger protein 840 isoform X2 [Dermacentor andersoni]